MISQWTVYSLSHMYTMLAGSTGHLSTEYWYMLLYEFLEKKTTPPPNTPTASLPTTKTEILLTSPEEEDTKKNRTSRKGPTVEINLAANPDIPESKSSSPVLPIIISVLGTLLMCGVVISVYKSIKRKLCSRRNRQEGEQSKIWAGPSTPIQKHSPVEIKREMYGFVSSILRISNGHMATYVGW